MQKQGWKTMMIAALLLCSGIMLGAFGRHGLEGRSGAHEMEIFSIAAHYQIFNALGLLILGFIHLNSDLKRFRLITNLLYAGILIFCATLYLIGSAPLWINADVRMLGAITPIGGSCMIIAWAVAAFSFWEKYKTVQ